MHLVWEYNLQPVLYLPPRFFPASHRHAKLRGHGHGLLCIVVA